MESAADFRKFAQNCLREAAETKDDARKQTLFSIAKLYNQTAIEIEKGATTTPRPLA